MESPVIFPQDFQESSLLPFSLNPDEKSQSFLHPWWIDEKYLAPYYESEEEGLGADLITEVVDDHVPFKKSILGPYSVETGRTIFLIGLSGIVFFIIFMIILIIWSKRMDKNKVSKNERC